MKLDVISISDDKKKCGDKVNIKSRKAIKLLDRADSILNGMLILLLFALIFETLFVLFYALILITHYA